MDVYSDVIRQRHSSFLKIINQSRQISAEVEAACEKRLEQAKKRLTEARERRSEMEKMIQQAEALLKFLLLAKSDPTIDRLTERIIANQVTINELDEKLKSEPVAENQVALDKIMQQHSIAAEQLRQLHEENSKRLASLIKEYELKKLKKEASEQQARILEMKQRLKNRGQQIDDDVKLRIEHEKKELHALKEEVRQEQERERRLLAAQVDEELFEKLRLKEKRETE